MNITFEPILTHIALVSSSQISGERILKELCDANCDHLIWADRDCAHFDDCVIQVVSINSNIRGRRYHQLFVEHNTPVPDFILASYGPDRDNQLGITYLEENYNNDEK